MFDVLQAAVPGLGNLPPEVGQRDDGETREQEECACAAEDAQNGQEGDGDREVRAPVGHGGHAHRLATDLDRVDLADQ